MRSDDKLRFISLQDFSNTTGIALSEVEELYAVKVAGCLQVPRFMLDDASDGTRFPGPGSQEASLSEASAAIDHLTPEPDMPASELFDSRVEDNADPEWIGPGDQTASLANDHSTDPFDEAGYNQKALPVDSYESDNNYGDVESSGTLEGPGNHESLDIPAGFNSSEFADSSDIVDNSDAGDGFVKVDGADSEDFDVTIDSTDTEDSYDNADASDIADSSDHADNHVTIDSSVFSECFDSYNNSDNSDGSEIYDSSDQLNPETDPFELLKNRVRLSQSQMQAGAFARFFARILDLALFNSPPAYAFLSLGNAFIDTSTPQQQLLAVIAVASVCIVVALFLDALCHMLAGNTPGKALLSLKVSDSAGNFLSFKSHLFRNYLLLVKGLAFMVFPFTLLTLFIQFRRVSQGRPTSYDAKRGTIVEDDSSGIINKFIFAIGLLVTLLMATSVASQLINSML